MKKVIFVLVLALFVFEGKSQLTDAQLISQADTIKYETKAGANTAIRVGRMFENIIYNKINSSYFIDSTRIPYLSKNNVFTGGNTFANITTGYIYGDQTSLSLQLGTPQVYATGNVSINGTANIGGSLTVDNTTIPYFSGDTTLSAAGGGAVPIMSAVKAYVTNHSSGGSFIDTTKIPYLAKTNKFTGIDSFATTVSNTLSIIDSVPKLNNSADTIASRSYVRYYVQANIPTPAYTEFSALAYQASTNPPTDTSILINTTSRTITYTYNSTGNYTLNISGASIPKSKIAYFVGGNLGIVNMSYSSNTITITTYSDALTSSNGILNFTPITIKIYN